MSVNIYAIVTILCLQTLSNCVVSNIGQYVYSFYLQTYSLTSNGASNLTNDTLLLFVGDLNVSSEDSGQCANSVLDDGDAWAQEQSADLFSNIGSWRSGPTIIMTCILGLYASNLGRRLVLILSMIGISIRFLIWLSIIYLQLQEYWWYVSAFVAGLTGGEGVLNLVLNLFVTDCTRESDRSTRLVLLEALTTALTALANFGIGYYVAWRGFTDLLWMSFALQSISILVVLVFFKCSTHSPLVSVTERDNDNRIENSRDWITNCRKSCHIFTIFHRHGQSKKTSVSLLLTLFAYIFYSLASTAILSTFLWYLLDFPFCWSSTQIGNYEASASTSCAVFSVLGMKLLIHVGASDASICALSHVFFFGLALWFAFAQHSWQLYTSLLISPFADYQNALTWSMMSKWLEPNDYSVAFTILTIVYTICSLLGDSLFNWIYALTVVDVPNLIFYLAAGLCIVPFILNISLVIINRRLSNDDISLLALPIDDSDLVCLDISANTTESQSNSSLSMDDESILNV